MHATAEAYLGAAAPGFDLVFLDPPFHRDLLAPALARLVAGAHLNPGARVYLEAEAELGEPPLPAGWALLRSKQAGDVGYHLAARDQEGA